MTQETPLVLLVEDEVLISFSLEQELKEAGFEVLSLARSGEALRTIEQQDVPYCALITDIDLGDEVDGWTLARRARELTPDLPIIYMSGKSGIEWKAHGVPESVMLQKPFVFAQLLTALTMLLNGLSSKS
jgi:DNA-binding response OmpR family regulator